MAIRRLNSDDIIDEDDDDGNWADLRAPSGGRSHPGDENDNYDGKGEEDTQGGEKGTGKGKEQRMGRGKGRGRGRKTVKGKVLLNCMCETQTQRAN
jgi:hypothetical protein